MASYATSCEDQFVIIKLADKDSCVVVCGREYYPGKEYKQFSDTSI